MRNCLITCLQNTAFCSSLLLCLCLCSCVSDREKVDIDPFRYPDLVDEREETVDGGLITTKYKGNVMYRYERMVSEDKSILVATLYCGFGSEHPLIKIRIYAEHKNVEHKVTEDYSYFQEEYISFRQEYIFFDNPMILMLETRDENGDLTKSGYISQWESSEFYEKFIKENNITHREIPEKTIIRQVTPRNALPNE